MCGLGNNVLHDTRFSKLFFYVESKNFVCAQIQPLTYSRMLRYALSRDAWSNSNSTKSKFRGFFSHHACCQQESKKQIQLLRALQLPQHNTYPLWLRIG